MSRRKRTTVLSYTQDGGRLVYRITSKPDYARIRKETIGEGAAAVLVFHGREDAFFMHVGMGWRIFPRSQAGLIIQALLAVLQ